ncbi:DUF4156 domain-containing protein [Alkalimarinus sediminis]|uniref:DUF4156 domain-containing protein n=1 Tax=Alkalimarinus sediminis TaxID=1632866 RepID=A0A9E8HRE1_9ALTE|nr:DUF4156 domain-containing protein [Alkalimarinus sediminis]UZW74384.1 DUF4156 domain-containing protein [Alkalimarinus sediminis]
MKKVSSSKLLISLPIISALVSGCSFVELKPDADAVRVLTADQAANCKSVGSVTTKVVDEVLLISRNEETMAEELEVLARNEALHSGANAIVPISDIEEGRRTYKAYLCP